MAISYVLKQSEASQQNLTYYNREDLELMTSYQLKEICREQKIINGIYTPLDKDELIHIIMRFRGREKHLFITKQSKEGLLRLEELLQTAKLYFQGEKIRGCAKLIAYHGLSMEYFDQFTIGYHKDIANTNVLLVSGNQICAIFNIRENPEDKEKLYLTKGKEIKCRESGMRNYALYCMDKSQSDLLFHLYDSNPTLLPEHLNFYPVEILNFEVRDLLETNMPLAIDFGTSNTTAGMYLDDNYLERLGADPIAKTLQANDVNYVNHLQEDGFSTTPVLPSVVGVTSIEGEKENKVHYVFGYEANRLFAMSYMDEGFCVFYDMKRWISDGDKLEEIVDRSGQHIYVCRKDIIKEYLEYIISCARQRFKCDIKLLHISPPVKQKELFHHFFKELLTDYTFESETVDEGVAVLYNSIAELIAQKKFQNKVRYNALIIDCGGGTTDLSSCQFSIENRRVSYHIDIETAYENGDTDFGGNNLTYRIMQLIKISLAHQLSDLHIADMEELMEEFDLDIFREVDEQQGSQLIYQKLEAEYDKAEEILPTRFKDYEHKNRSDYFAVKNNYYFLFDMAEKVKTEFYHKIGTLRIALSTIELKEIATTCLKVSRWKLYSKEQNQLQVMKDIPTVYISNHEINQLLRADIYAIVRKFIGQLSEDGKLAELSIIRLTGQSCKIDIFREALKEFIPGRTIGSIKRGHDTNSLYELKLNCLNGAIKYLKDKKFGYADIQISSKRPAFPYKITAFTHEQKEIVLLNGIKRQKTHGSISRNMGNLTLKLFLKDPEDRLRYTYSYHIDPDEFETTNADFIIKQYNKQILQDDMDDIMEKELKFFVMTEESKWGFKVVPVARLDNLLKIGQEQFFSFETEGWLTSFFDGTK